jgi:hypothetical protein
MPPKCGCWIEGLRTAVQFFAEVRRVWRAELSHHPTDHSAKSPDCEEVRTPQSLPYARRRAGCRHAHPTIKHRAPVVGWACLASRKFECSSDHLAKPPDCEEVRTPQSLPYARRRAGCRHAHPTIKHRAPVVGWACLASRKFECSSDHLAKSPDCEEVRTPQSLPYARRRAGCRHAHPTTTRCCMRFSSPS